MEPLFVQQIVFGGSEDSDTEDENDRFNRSLEIPDVTETLQANVNAFETDLVRYKNALYENTVSRVKDHEPISVNAMETYHALWTASLAFLLGIFSKIPTPRPSLSPKLQTYLTKLAEFVKETKEESSDGADLTYNILFQYQTSHPFQLGKKDAQN